MKNWAFYNEWDGETAQWLRELIKRGLIPDGYVDERSITDVDPYDLKEFTQAHWFAGIGGWSLALRMVGWDDDRPVWTGSPPCQPFSVAGKGLAQDDPRHLAPTFMRLVSECRPPVLFGEQVAAAISKNWLDDLFVHLEGQGYTCGAAVLPACGIGAPHKRDRLFFGAYYQLAHTTLVGVNGSGDTGPRWRDEHTDGCRFDSVADANGIRGSWREITSQGGIADGKTSEWEEGVDGCVGGCEAGAQRLAHSDNDRQQSGCGRRCGSGEPSEGDDVRRGSTDGRMGDAAGEGLEGLSRDGSAEGRERPVGSTSTSGVPDNLADSESFGRSEQHTEPFGSGKRGEQEGLEQRPGRGGVLPSSGPADPYHGFWRDADWLGCRDGKFRPVRSGTFPLANGLPGRVVRLRAYGNAIVPQVGAAFIESFEEAITDLRGH